MRLTNDEKAILLGIMEDLSQEDDIVDQPMDIKETIVSVIGKLGGTYFGKLNDIAKTHHEPTRTIYRHYCDCCGYEWWNEEIFSHKCPNCDYVSI